MFKKLFLIFSIFLITSCGKETSQQNMIVAEESAMMPQKSRSLMVMGASRSCIGGRCIMPPAPIARPDIDRDKYENTEENTVKLVEKEAVSTFSIDVDTASYANVRRFLNDGYLPPKDAVRIEEMVNYFDYNYPAPKNKETPFKATAKIVPTPWNKDTKLLHIGIKGYEIQKKERPKSNLVFLLDTSGSMNSKDKLPLLKRAIEMIVKQMDKNDKISMVVYAGSAGVVLEPTSGNNKSKILNALNKLSAGGSTAGGEGIRRAYELAEQNFDKTAVNRVILGTDGDFNVGITDPEKLEDFIERKRKSGVYLSILGFGRGNYNDALMQKLAQSGNGNASYLDGILEARKVLVDEMTSTLFPIANDVKIQVEFNPNRVAEYRLIGYETRMLKEEDFKNDKVDAGDIGAGHTVTAIYEITELNSNARLLGERRYSKNKKNYDKNYDKNSEYAFLKIRYKHPGESKSKLITEVIDNNDEIKNIKQASDNIRFSIAVAGFAQILKQSKFISDFDYDDVMKLAKKAKGDDEFEYRSEFIRLIRLAETAKEQKPLNNNGHIEIPPYRRRRY